MIVLDTHIWVWWVHEPGNLTQRQIDEVKKNEGNIIGISAISCWEIAKLVEYNRNTGTSVTFYPTAKRAKSGLKVKAEVKEKNNLSESILY